MRRAGLTTARTVTKFTFERPWALDTKLGTKTRAGTPIGRIR